MIVGTTKTGLRFLATSAALLVLATLCLWPLLEELETGKFSNGEVMLFYGGLLLGFLATATGLVAVMFLVSGGVQWIGSRIGAHGESRN